MNQKPDKQVQPPGRLMGEYIALGAGIGVALGVAFDNLSIGIAIGAGIGTALGAILESQNNRKAK